MTNEYLVNNYSKRNPQTGMTKFILLFLNLSQPVISDNLQY